MWALSVAGETQAPGSEGRWLVALLGGRMHYAVPRHLHTAGGLEQLFTDFFAGQGWARVLGLVPRAVRPAGLRRMLGRVPAGVPGDRITAFNWFGLRYALRRRRAADRPAARRAYLWANRRFSELVRGSDWGQAGAVYTFNGAGLEILERAKTEGLIRVVEQTIAASGLEDELLGEEQRRHPGWEQPGEAAGGAEYRRREEAEWGLADGIVCGSEFVRESIRLCGGPVHKCAVVPYGVGLPAEPGQRRTRANGGPLRVLVAGAVCLRKGAPYVLAAAKALAGKAAFRWVGPVRLLPKAARELEAAVELAGPVPRAEMEAAYQWADVFLLPSVCEGSATVTYEALSRGLPVICTPNAGSVVRDGLDGFIVPVRSAEAIVARLRQLLQGRALLAELSANALARAAEFDLASYGRRLLAALASARDV